MSALFAVAFFGALRGTNAQGQEPPGMSRWGLGAAFTYCTAHVAPAFERLDLSTPGYAFAVHYRPTVGRTCRFAYGSNFKQTERRMVKLEAAYFGGATTTTVLESSWWYHEVQADLVLRPLTWAQAGAGPYFTCGITWRLFSYQDRFPELTAKELSAYFPEGDPELPWVWDLYWVFRGGVGYDRSIGPLFAYVEVDGQASCVPSLDGEGFTFGWGSAVGLRYVFRSRSASGAAIPQ